MRIAGILLACGAVLVIGIAMMSSGVPKLDSQAGVRHCLSLNAEFDINSRQALARMDRGETVEIISVDEYRQHNARVYLFGWVNAAGGMRVECHNIR
jgi:hypothetical protein